MGRSSRVVVLACVLAATPALGQTRSVLMRAPAKAVHALPRTAHLMPRNMPRPVARANIASTRAAARRVPRGNGLGLFGAGLGISLADDLAAPPLFGGDEGFEPAVVPGITLPPCVRPRIIKIGLGVRRKARTRVIYGTPTGCTP